MKFGAKFFKYNLIAINNAFVLVGIFLFVIGLTMKYEDDLWETRHVLAADDDLQMVIGVYLVIVAGVLTITAGLVGILAAIKEKQILLLMYIGMLAVVLLCETVALIRIIVHREKLDSDVIDKLHDSFKDDWKYNNNKWSSFAETINLVQRDFDCCGIEGPQDYDMVKLENKNNNITADKLCRSEDALYPPTCFKVNCNNFDTNHNKLTCDDVQTNYLYAQGCGRELKNFISDYIIIQIVVSVIFATLQIIAATVAFSLWRTNRKQVLDIKL